MAFIPYRVSDICPHMVMAGFSCCGIQKYTPAVCCPKYYIDCPIYQKYHNVTRKITVTEIKEPNYYNNNCNKHTIKAIIIVICLVLLLSILLLI